MSFEASLLVYMLVAMGITALVTRFAPTVRVPENLPPLVALGLVGIWVTFGAVGAYAPILIQEAFLADQPTWVRLHPPAFGALGRFAQVVGGVCGLVTGFRGTGLWMYAIALGLLVAGARWVLP